MIFCIILYVEICSKLQEQARASSRITARACHVRPRETWIVFPQSKKGSSPFTSVLAKFVSKLWSVVNTIYKMLDASRLATFLLVLVYTSSLAKICAGTGGSFLRSVKEEAASIQPWLVGLRRQFHQVPELMYEEIETGKLIRQTLDDLGITYRQIHDSFVQIISAILKHLAKQRL